MLESIRNLSVSDLPWDQLPPWIGAAVAVVVGTFTIRNVRTARRAYQDGAWEKKVATARLVWSESRIVTRIDPDDRYYPEHLWGDDVVGWTSSAKYTYQPSEHDDYLEFHEAALLIEAKVVNNSKEVIGHVSVRVTDSDGTDIVGLSSLGRVLGPESTVVAYYFVAADAGATVVHTVSTLWFRDSAGHHWRRQISDPPVVEENPPTV